MNNPIFGGNSIHPLNSRPFWSLYPKFGINNMAQGLSTVQVLAKAKKDARMIKSNAVDGNFVQSI